VHLAASLNFCTGRRHPSARRLLASDSHSPASFPDLISMSGPRTRLETQFIFNISSKTFFKCIFLGGIFASVTDDCWFNLDKKNCVGAII